MAHHVTVNGQLRVSQEINKKDHSPLVVKTNTSHNEREASTPTI